MGTVIFDFDSTLITRESLEEILKPRIGASPGLGREISRITRLGMEGELSFAESLRQRLTLAAPTLDQVRAFGNQASRLLTPGMEDVVRKLHEKGATVRIVSGGLYEGILPVARHLNIPRDQVHAVRLLWDADGKFAGIDPKDPFSEAKPLGVAALVENWEGPRIVVGDGMTDYRLFEQGLVDHFILFTQNVRRHAILRLGVTEAPQTQRLMELLEKYL